MATMVNNINYSLARVCTHLMGIVKHAHKKDIVMNKTRKGSRVVISEKAAGSYNIVLNALVESTQNDVFDHFGFPEEDDWYHPTMEMGDEDLTAIQTMRLLARLLARLIMMSMVFFPHHAWLLVCTGA